MVEKLTDRLAAEVQAPTTSGAIVWRMTRDSESYEAGLRPGDVIVEFNRQPVEDPSQFFRLVADAKVGSTATVRVLRDGRRLEFTLPIVSSSESSPRRR
jgi:S1-C subfamily serine protease